MVINRTEWLENSIVFNSSGGGLLNFSIGQMSTFFFYYNIQLYVRCLNSFIVKKTLTKYNYEKNISSIEYEVIEKGNKIQLIQCFYLFACRGLLCW